jgi:hypothetical protein
VICLHIPSFQPNKSSPSLSHTFLMPHLIFAVLFCPSFVYLNNSLLISYSRTITAVNFIGFFIENNGLGNTNRQSLCYTVFFIVANLLVRVLNYLVRFMLGVTPNKDGRRRNLWQENFIFAYRRKIT